MNNFDFLQFKKAYNTSAGQPGYNPQFDYNQNGRIDNGDYLQVKKNYLMSFPALAASLPDSLDTHVLVGASSSESSVAVPEPSMLSLLGLGAVAGRTRRRR